jgi:phenylpropionate dioxygenase-like ring-hydroxylating dioxygenase large terminal subunit
VSDSYKVDPKDYFDSDYFKVELQNILEKYWVFVCPSAILKNSGDYFVFNGLGRDLVIRRNVEGLPISFNNVCKHRGHKLFEDSFGNSDIRCGYHGWLYDETLSLKKIPWNGKCYHIDEETIKLDKGVALKEADGVIWGYFGNKKIIDVEYPASAIGENLALFNKMSSSTRGVTVNERSFNWKLIFENLYDRAHPGFLHAKSLNQYVDLSFDAYPNNFDFDGVEQFVKANFANTGFAKNANGEKLEKFDENMPEGAYLNGHVFPFLHFVTPDGGSTFCYESYIPISENAVKVYTFWVAGLKQEVGVRSLYVLENLKIASQILAEDWAAVESIAAVKNKPKNYNYGAHEKNFYGLKKLGESNE